MLRTIAMTMTWSKSFSSFLFLLFSSCKILASRDDGYYPRGTTNPLVNEPLYWRDAQNILEDLSSLQSLSIKFHSCVWSPSPGASGYRQLMNNANGDEANEDNEDEVNENDYWYMGLMPSQQANVAFSLYGTTAESTSSYKCDKKHYINSFYTTAGFLAFVNSAIAAGVLGNGTQFTTDLTAECDQANGYGVSCSWGKFALLKYENTQFSNYPTCHASEKAFIVDHLEDLNDYLKGVNCIEIYNADNNNEADNYDVDDPLTLLSFSSACYSSDPFGACPDPHGALEAYTKVYTKAAYPNHGMSTVRKIKAWVLMGFGFLALLVTLNILVREGYDTFQDHSTMAGIRQKISRRKSMIETKRGDSSDEDEGTSTFEQRRRKKKAHTRIFKMMKSVDERRKKKERESTNYQQEYNLYTEYKKNKKATNATVIKPKVAVISPRSKLQVERTSRRIQRRPGHIRSRSEPRPQLEHRLTRPLRRRSQSVPLKTNHYSAFISFDKKWRGDRYADKTQGSTTPLRYRTLNNDSFSLARSDTGRSFDTRSPYKDLSKASLPMARSDTGKSFDTRSTYKDLSKAESKVSERLAAKMRLLKNESLSIATPAKYQPDSFSMAHLDTGKSFDTRSTYKDLSKVESNVSERLAAKMRLLKNESRSKATPAKDQPDSFSMARLYTGKSFDTNKDLNKSYSRPVAASERLAAKVRLLKSNSRSAAMSAEDRLQKTDSHLVAMCDQPSRKLAHKTDSQSAAMTEKSAKDFLISDDEVKVDFIDEDEKSNATQGSRISTYRSAKQSLQKMKNKIRITRKGR